ncbi:MAG TPA: ATP-binding protein [Calditrichia bacterium]|nr:HAMP domain-containing histidine kinase [Calditrichota bacterium]HQU71913.1 ATP-binding protein [Calditrichia bacterium]HQV30991.1 ATP-binding protein [Calditrichia bacterium]
MTPLGKRTFDTRSTFPLAIKIGLLLSILLMGTVLGIGFFNYQRNKAMILGNIQSQLQLAANSLASTIDGDQFQTLRGRESMDTPAYREIHDRINHFYHANKHLGFNRNWMYAFRPYSPDTLQFAVMLDERFVGNLYPVRAEMFPAIIGTSGSYTGVYMDENGMWVSAYAPILNSDGASVGIVEVDFRDNIYLMAVEEEVSEVLISSIIGGILAIVLAAIAGRYISRPIARVSKAVLRFSEGAETVEVPVSTRDEIGMLGRAFNYMVKEVREKELLQEYNKELQEAYQKLDRMNKSLEEANQLKSEFLGIAAHDLKNPLQVIQGFAERILNTGDQEEKVYHAAEKIHTGAERMLRIIRQLLDNTAIERGALLLKKTPVDIQEMVEKVYHNNLPLARRKEQDFLLQKTDAPIWADVDPDRMHQILDNLVSNAIKFTPFGGRIRLFFELSPEEGENPGKWRFRVEDNGPGLSEDDKNCLFRKFNRLSAKPSGGEVSTGLGLALVKDLMTLHGGQVGAESEGPGLGSSFWIEMAVCSQHPAPEEHSS